MSAEGTPTSTNPFEDVPSPDEATDKSQDEVPPELSQKEKEKEIMMALLKEHDMVGYKPGKLYYIMDKQWLRSWKAYVGYDAFFPSNGQRPGEIDNSPILDDEGKVRRGYTENFEYVVLSPEVWNQFVEWFVTRFCALKETGTKEDQKFNELVLL